MKKSNRQKLVKKLYKLVYTIVHSRGECELCKRTEGKLDLHHIQGRTGQLKYCLDNCILLCFRCHRLRVHSPSSFDQNKAREEIIALRGDIDELVKLKDIKLSMAELEELHKKLNENT